MKKHKREQNVIHLIRRADGISNSIVDPWHAAVMPHLFASCILRLPFDEIRLVDTWQEYDSYLMDMKKARQVFVCRAFTAQSPLSAVPIAALHSSP
jgi:hypothetical protein